MRPLAAVLLAALLAIPVAASERPRGSGAGVPDVDLLRLDPRMASFLVERVKPRLEPKARVYGLVDALFGKKGLEISYDDSATKTAAETFQTGSGNCLSFTVLFVAMARHLGLDAYFLEVDEVMSWDRRGQVILRNHHMFAEIESQNGHIRVDFLPGAEKRYRAVRRIRDRRALAHYYNNVGAETLASGDAELAAAYFRRALEVDEVFGYAWTNLGVAQRHLGDVEAAEASHRQAMASGEGTLTATANLASLYLTVGREEEAGPLLLRVEDYLDKNPFHQFRSGQRSLLAGDAEAAIESFRKALRRLPRDPELQAALGDAYLRAGDRAKARARFERALELVPEDSLRQRLETELAALGGQG